MRGDLLLHSVSYAGLWGQAFLPLDAFVDKAADLGFQGVMLMAKRPHLSVLDFGPKERAQLRAHLEARQLRTICVAGYTNFTADLEHGDIPNREIHIQHTVELARLAADLGGSLVRVFTGYEVPSRGYAWQCQWVAEALREAARRAADFGVTLGVQNHHDLAVSTEAFHDLVQSVGDPHCRAMFDAWAPALHGDDLSAAARRMGGVTVHTTIANYQLRRRFHYDPALVNYRPQPPALQAVPIEEGFIDYRAFLQALSAGGFRGSVAYEMCSPLRDGSNLETLDRYARLFVEFMRRFQAEDAAAPL